MAREASIARRNTRWRPSADMEVLRLRARLLAKTREFFALRGVLEVDTPALSVAAATDPDLASFTTVYTGPDSSRGRRLFLQTSPEFPMKRLLAAGSGSIYQIAKVFRDGESGARHNPEFTLLEWYRPGFDHHRLMDEVEALVQALLGGPGRVEAGERLSYAKAFQGCLGVDPHRASVAELAACAAVQGIVLSPTMPVDDVDPWLDLLLSHCVEPWLGRRRLAFLYDYPASQASLARIRSGEPPLAERFELYVDGVELANGFHELGDAQEQRRRFTRDNRVRALRGLPVMPADEQLLAALAEGLPACAGVALGFDRLVMLAAGKESLAQAMAFPSERA